MRLGEDLLFIALQYDQFYIGERFMLAVRHSVMLLGRFKLTVASMVMLL